MNQLVLLENNVPVTTSLMIAEGTNNDHNSTIKLVRKYLNDLKDFGAPRFEIQRTKGFPIEYAYLNEEQATFLISLMNNSTQVIEFKKRLVKEFFRMRKLLNSIAAQKENPEWQKLRSSGKWSRLEETDTIKLFIEYAVCQGSHSAQNYYSLLTKLENRALFMLDACYKGNSREALSIKQLMLIQTADMVVIQALRDGMEQRLYYKDIYRLAKSRLDALSGLLPKSKIPGTELIAN